MLAKNLTLLNARDTDLTFITSLLHIMLFLIFIVIPGLTPNRMLRMVDKFTNSKMFDKLTDTDVVRKFMQVVANKDISLFVELQGLAGRLVLNIPPPPSDRLWYVGRWPK